jgi:hypothetical protein
LIFLGAGASAADGAPIQGAVFREYARGLQHCDNDDIRLPGTAWSPETAFPSFMRDFFGIDTLRDDIDAVDFPTFEEALGVLELARARGESFGGFDHRFGQSATNLKTEVVLKSFVL